MPYCDFYYTGDMLKDKPFLKGTLYNEDKKTVVYKGCFSDGLTQDRRNCIAKISTDMNGNLK